METITQQQQEKSSLVVQIKRFPLDLHARMKAAAAIRRQTIEDFIVGSVAKELNEAAPTRKESTHAR